MRAVVPVVMVVLAGCPAVDDSGSDGAGSATENTAVTTETTDLSASAAVGATSMDADTTSTDPCAGIELPLCDYCPSLMLCGFSCGVEGQTCWDEFGNGLSCASGEWGCFVALHPPSGGCERGCEPQDRCTEIGCFDGLTIALGPDRDGVTAGSYLVRVEADGVIEECTLELSDDPSLCQVGPPCVPETTCNALVLLEPDDRIEILVGVAAEVTVTVQRDAEPPVLVSQAPIYDVVSPNGPGCTPVCAVATLEVAAL